MTTEPADQPAHAPVASRPIVPKSASEALRPERGLPPPRRSKQSRNQFVVFMNFLLSCIVLVAIGALVAVYVGKSMFDAAGPATQADTVLIRPNTGLNEIAQLLAREGLISNATVFRLGVHAAGAQSALKAGEYEIKPGASMRDIMDVLQSGRSVLYSLTIPEGLTVRQALGRIEQSEVLSGEMPADVPAEGAMMADTERFTRGMSRKALIDKLVARQSTLVDDIWERRKPDLPIETKEEFVTLASIVEKETGVADERPRVAAVFINRLREGMRLQSDPTIVYGLFGGAGKPANRAIYRSDIDRATPYNTYRIDGLPPGPIAIPGLASLEAVANPSTTSELYFVADGSGGHVFAETLEEHNENVARWRQVRASQGADAEALPVEE